MYKGKTGSKRENTLIGVDGEVLKKLYGILPQWKSYKVFAVNLFASVALMQELQRSGFQFTETVCVNRLTYR